MSNSIRAEISEYNSLLTEKKQLSSRLRKINYRLKQLSPSINNSLKQNGQIGVRYGNKGYITHTKNKTLSKSTKERNVDALKVLRKAGVNNPAEVLFDILKARKGEQIQVDTIKIINSK